MHHARKRGGFILAVVIALSIIIGMLVFMYYQGFRHRDTQVRMSSDRASARYLARAGLDLLKYAFHEAPDPTKLASPDIENGSLLPFLMGDAKSLTRRVQQKTDGKEDHRELIRQLVGQDALEPIDKLAAKLPQAKVMMWLDLQPAELWSGATSAVIRDPVLKSVAITYDVCAYVRGAHETFRATDTIDVHSLLPVGASRFTMAVTGEGQFYNTHRVTTQGADLGGAAPVVLFHSPTDCDPLTENPFELKPTAQKSIQSGVTSPDQLLKASVGRGMVFLPGTFETPVRLQLASGGTPFGEYHTVSQPKDGRTAYPVAANLPEQPAKAKAFRAVDPADPLVRQSCTVQGAVFGFFDQIDQQQLLGPPLPGAAQDACSQLKLFGTGTNPSAGVVVGNVYRTVAALSDIAIDRDDTGKDESEQTASVGRALPIREGIDPFLRSATAAEFAADVGSEGAGPGRYTRLLPFGRNGFIQNVNAAVDLDGTGRMTAVASEATHNPIQLNPGLWKYSNLFENYDEYLHAMSKYMEFPANLSLELGGLAPDRARDVLLEAAFSKNAGSFKDWMLREPQLEFTDMFHQKLTGSGGSKYYLDAKGHDVREIAQAIGDGIQRRYPMEPLYVVKGMRRFQEYFMPGGQIDLQGLKVTVVPDDNDPIPPLAFDGDVTVKPGSGGTLVVPRFKAKSLKNAGTDAGYAPFVLQTGELVMTGKGPFEGIIQAQAILQEKVPDYTVVRGSLVVGALPATMTNPLVVAYDPRNDPTGKNANLYYRGEFRKDQRQYELEDR